MSGPWSYETTVFLQKQGCLQWIEQGAGERLLKRAGEATNPGSAGLCCGQATAEAWKQPQREQTHVDGAAFPRNSIYKAGGSRIGPGAVVCHPCTESVLLDPGSLRVPGT